MSKSKLSASEWELVKDAPFWVNAALSAADGRVALIVKRKEAKALNKAMEANKSSNQLIRDVVANDDEPANEIAKATQAEAEKKLGRISEIVERKLGDDDLDAFNAFLLSVGRSVAESAGEGVLGIGKNVSDAESGALGSIATALEATDAHKRARRQEKQAAERDKRAAQAKASAEAKAKAEAAAKAKEEAEKAKAAAEIQAKMKAQQQKRDAEAKARELAMAKEKAKREAEAKAEAAAKAAEEAKAKAARKSRFTEFIAEHKVVSGENLSLISQKYYNTQANFRLIYEANQDVIGDNPNLIRVGQVLKIPKL